MIYQFAGKEHKFLVTVFAYDIGPLNNGKLVTAIYGTVSGHCQVLLHYFHVTLVSLGSDYRAE
jgi:hypothetical protein